MVAWWRWVEEVEEAVVGPGRRASRRQVARPAVEVSFLDQTSFTPPVEAARAATWPPATASSTSLRNASARACLEASKAFCCAIAALSFFAGDLLGLLGAGTLSSSSGTGNNCRRMGDLEGEYVSFQSLMSEALQKASRLGRCGEGGMRAWVDLEGDWRRGFEGEVGGVVRAGGVRGRTVEGGLRGESAFLRGERERGGELEGG